MLLKQSLFAAAAVALALASPASATTAHQFDKITIPGSSSTFRVMSCDAGNAVLFQREEYNNGQLQWVWSFRGMMGSPFVATADWDTAQITMNITSVSKKSCMFDYTTTTK